MKKSIRQRLALYCFTTMIMFSFMFSQPIVAKSYVFKWSNIKEIEVTATYLNIRTGPGTSYTIIGTLSRGTVVNVVGSLGSWYVIHTDRDMIGLISSTYTRVKSYYNTNTSQTPTTPTPTPQAPTPTTPADSYSYAITADEQQMIDLINAERSKNGLSALKADISVMKVARIKAEDLSKNQYFSHDSPKYGSPFEMLKTFGVAYKAAGENIAGNTSVSAAHKALMNSPGHRANILKTNFDTIGIGIYNDARYGKVFAQIFLQK
ncbi:MAG: SCP-like extracellular protein [Firmicutes bacterium HGW-Firmicutes-7]|nr:MAG: SCP-like extracellular protein [Firmicutes bacterium HGW-Firmicutes-7]